MAIQVKTIIIKGHDWDEIDREETRELGRIESATNWRVFHVETVQSRTTEVSGQSGLSVTVRVYSRDN